MNRHLTVVLVLVVLAGCGGLVNNPPGGNYIGVQTVEHVISPQGSRIEVGSWYISGRLIEFGPPPTVGDVDTTGSAAVRSGSNGYYYLSNAIVPATWQWTYKSGGCQLYTAADDFVQHDVKPFVCQITISDAFSYGYLTDGSPVYTGGGDKLVVGMNETLYADDCRTSPDSDSQLCYQSDGNLVFYNGGAPVWASNTSGTTAGFAAMQGDGNFVVYDASSNPVWASNTGGYSGAFVTVQSNACALMYSSDGSFIPWGTASCQ